jgi:hypothetical protein
VRPNNRVKLSKSALATRTAAFAAYAGVLPTEMSESCRQVESRFGFKLPAAYRAFFEAGWMDPASPDYLWVPEAEWLTPKQMLEYEPAEYHKPGFVPFAFTGAGDHWCWWPAEHPDLVVLCPHDCSEGEFDAPSFIASIYRRMLGYAHGGFFEDEEEEARDNLRRWASRLSAHFPGLWIETLLGLAAAPIVKWASGVDGGLCGESEYARLLERDVAFPLMGKSFEWMYP